MIGSRKGGGALKRQLWIPREVQLCWRRAFRNQGVQDLPTLVLPDLLYRLFFFLSFLFVHFMITFGIYPFFFEARRLCVDSVEL